jgi:hypothetical protein
MRCKPSAVLALIMMPAVAAAHHGVASLGAAGLEGPGAPVETSSSATLPAGSWLACIKLDYASFQLLTPERDAEADVSAFWLYGLGYGARPWLSLYLFAPFNAKRSEDNSYTSAGFADLSATAVLGLKWDGRLRLVPASESLDDLEDPHFTVYGGLSLPTGEANLRDAGGAIDPGMSLGFGKPFTMLGLTATQQPSARLTVVQELSWIGFSKYEYDDGVTTRFGSELRANGAMAFRFAASQSHRVRLDGNLEAGFLQLGRDESDAGGGMQGEEATGGSILYLLPGLRLYRQSMSLAAGVKLPIWTNLNEEKEQQGAEGTENYRLIAGLSTLF